MEKVSEEITFHEVRETLIYGLTNGAAMKKLAKTGFEEFEHRVNDRIDSLRQKNRKKLQEFEIDLKYSKDIRFGLDKAKMGIGSTAQPAPALTLTAMIEELLRKETNAELPVHEQLRYARRSELKNIISKIFEMISVSYTKMRIESLPLVLDSKPDLVKPDWEDLQSECESENDSHSIDISPTGTNRSPQTSHSATYLHRKSFNEKPISETVFSSVSPTHLPHLASPEQAVKKVFNYNAFKKDKTQGSTQQQSSTNTFEDSDLESELAAQEQDSVAHESSTIRLDPVPTEVDDTMDSQNIELATERAFYNIGKIKENFYLHLFDFKIRKIFDMDEKTYPSFCELKKDSSLRLTSAARRAAGPARLLPGQEKHHGVRA